MYIWQKRMWEKILELTFTEITSLNKKRKKEKLKAILYCEDIDTFEMERAYRSPVPGPFVEESCWAVIIKLLRFKEKEIILIKAIQYPKEKKQRI